MTKFILRDVRGFVGEHSFDVRPITLFVGENSAGKSTVLSVIDIMSKRSFPVFADFDYEYSFGSFKSIKSNLNKRKTFSLGYDKESSYVKADFIDSRNFPVMSKAEVRFEGYSCIIINKGSKISVKISEGKSLFIEADLEDVSTGDDLEYVLYLAASDRKETIGEEIAEKFIDDLFKAKLDLPPCRLISPIRSKTYRNYDPLRRRFDKSGKHLPYIMSLALETESRRTKYLKMVREFGKESGLFDDVTVFKHNENSPESPFQIQVSVRGRFENIFEVGYGVGQVMPIMAETLFVGPEQRLLIQQPEVHLHPKAQAAFASYLCNFIKSVDASFVLETHSDYIVDRLGIHVKDGTLERDKVIVYFFEYDNKGSSMRAMEFDEMGVLQNQHPSYRSFFLRERRQMMRSKYS